MIDLDGIFGALVEQWRDFPTISFGQFASNVEDRGIATVAEVTLYMQHFVDAANEFAMMDGDDWDALQARVQVAGLDRAVHAGSNIHSSLRRRAEFRIQILISERAQIQGFLDVTQAKIPLVETGRVWVEANAPGSAEQKAAVLEALDAGKVGFESTVAALQRQIDMLNAEIERYGGTP